MQHNNVCTDIGVVFIYVCLYLCLCFCCCRCCFLLLSLVVAFASYRFPCNFLFFCSSFAAWIEHGGGQRCAQYCSGRHFKTINPSRDVRKWHNWREEGGLGWEHEKKTDFPCTTHWLLEEEAWLRKEATKKRKDERERM